MIMNLFFVTIIYNFCFFHSSFFFPFPFPFLYFQYDFEIFSTTIFLMVYVQRQITGVIFSKIFHNLAKNLIVLKSFSTKVNILTVGNVQKTLLKVFETTSSH